MGKTSVSANNRLQAALHVLDSPRVPDAQAVIRALSICKDLATGLKDKERLPSPAKAGEKSADNGPSPAPDLLFAEDEQSSSSRIHKTTVASTRSNQKQAGQEISDVAFTIVKDPKVFITLDILRLYVSIQILLQRPATLPEVFHLYAHKPAPNPDTSPVTYRPARPDVPNAAIPVDVAGAALDAAMDAQDMNLSLDVLERTVGQPAFRRRKVFVYLAAPGAGLAFIPYGFWNLGTWLAQYQNTMPPWEARNYLFLGLTTWFYLLMGFGGMAALGRNSRIDRVTWEEGTLFHIRWMREEERWFLDRIANHWGFKDRRRRGEEEGPEWEALRDYCGMRAMVLDAAHLMDDME